MIEISEVDNKQYSSFTGQIEYKYQEDDASLASRVKSLEFDIAALKVILFKTNGEVEQLRLLSRKYMAIQLILWGAILLIQFYMLVVS